MFCKLSLKYKPVSQRKSQPRCIWIEKRRNKYLDISKESRRLETQNQRPIFISPADQGNAYRLKSNLPIYAYLTDQLNA